MSLTILKVITATGLLIASVALPFAVHSRARGNVRDVEEVLQRQADELNQLTSENARLSNALAATEGRSLAAGEFQELLRLRGEVARLREQTNVIHQLHLENQRLEAGSAAPLPPRTLLSDSQFNEALAAETLQAMKNVLAELPSAMQKFAGAHNGERPTDFSQLRKYFPASGGRMTGLYTFEFVRHEGPQPGDALILREIGSHGTPDGKQVRVYSFTDGTVLEVATTDNDFDTWEKEHLKSPPPVQ